VAESLDHQQGEGGEILERLEAANIDTGDIMQVQSSLSLPNTHQKGVLKSLNPKFIINLKTIIGFC